MLCRFNCRALTYIKTLTYPIRMYRENESLFALMNRGAASMTRMGMKNGQENEVKQDFLEKRGFTWGALVVLLVLTLIAALVLAYLITVRNFPAH